MGLMRIWTRSRVIKVKFTPETADDMICCAYNVFMNNGFTEIGDEMTDGFQKIEDKTQAQRILNEFDPEGPMVHIQDLYLMDNHACPGGRVFHFWRPRNLQSTRQLRVAFQCLKLSM